MRTIFGLAAAAFLLAAPVNEAAAAGVSLWKCKDIPSATSNRI